MNNITIPEHYDTAGIITADSNASEEFAIWQAHAAANPSDWTGAEFTLADFEKYIESTEYIILIHGRGDYLTDLKPDGEVIGGSAEEAIGYTEKQAKDLCAEIGNCSYETRESALAKEAE